MTQFRVFLSLGEINHLLTLLNERADDGTYYGNQQQYYDRTTRLIRELEKATARHRGRRSTRTGIRREYSSNH